MPQVPNNDPQTLRGAATARRSKLQIKYELQPFHYNVPDDQLIYDLNRVARKQNASTFTQAVYRRHGQFNPLTLSQRFGGWNAALLRAGLQPSRTFRPPPPVVIADIQRVAKELKTRKLLGTDYVAHGLYSMPVIYRLFNNWQGALQAARLIATSYRPKTPDQDLLDNLETLWQHHRRQPRCTELIPPLSRFGLTPYQRRFGNYQNALQAFILWKQTNQLPPPKLKMKRKTPRSINWRLRFLILRRDHYKCQACGRSPATDQNVKLQIDHTIPIASGGETIESNLQTLCTQCNIGKSNLPM